MRTGVFIAIAVLAFGGAGAKAQQVDFSGKWSLSGQIVAGRTFMSFAQICDLKQTGDQLAGPVSGAEWQLFRGRRSQRFGGGFDLPHD